MQHEMMNQHEMDCLELQRSRSSFRFCRRLAELGGHCMSRNVALAAAEWRERKLEVAHKNVAMMSSSPVEMFDPSFVPHLGLQVAVRGDRRVAGTLSLRYPKCRTDDFLWCFTTRQQHHSTTVIWALRRSTFFAFMAVLVLHWYD